MSWWRAQALVLFVERLHSGAMLMRCLGSHWCWKVQSRTCLARSDQIERVTQTAMPMAQDRHLGQRQNKSGLSALPTSNNSRPCGWANVVPGKMASGGGGEGGQQSSNKGNEQRPPSKQASKQARHFLTAQSFSPRSCCCCKLEKMRGWIGWYTAKTAKPQGANKINQTPKSSTTAGERCIMSKILPLVR